MNAQGEYYLTDLVAIAAREGVNISDISVPVEEGFGINTRSDLAQVEAILAGKRGHQPNINFHEMKEGMSQLS